MPMDYLSLMIYFDLGRNFSNLLIFRLGCFSISLLGLTRDFASAGSQAFSTFRPVNQGRFGP
jgi:hypothetical protein